MNSLPDYTAPDERHQRIHQLVFTAGAAIPEQYKPSTVLHPVSFNIWALQDGTTVVIGGKTNRAKIKFPEEMNRVLDRVPEINKPSDVSIASTMVDDMGTDEGIKLTDMLKLLNTLLCSMEAMK
ncbi:hypothetical protein Tco_0687933 [Tanacetum coccineum]